MSGEHNISYVNSRILFCRTSFFNHIKGSIYKITFNPLLYKGEDFLLCLRIRLQKKKLKFR
jgi:hypothetical protein